MAPSAFLLDDASDFIHEFRQILGRVEYVAELECQLVIVGLDFQI